MRTRTRLIGLLATLILLGIVIGLPATLLALGANPIPRSLPTLEQLRSAVTTPDDGTLALGAIKAVSYTHLDVYKRQAPVTIGEAQVLKQ